MSGSTAIATLSDLNNWPACVAYWQQRRVFAGSNQNPTGIWMTQPGNYANMNTSIVPRDDDAIFETIAAPPPGASTQVNEIRAMVPMPSGLLVFSSGGAWQITGNQQSSAITPSTVSVQAHAFNGISERVSPIPINYELLYVQEKGSIVRDMSYNYYINVYAGTDLSALSNHLFSGRQIVSWCWAEEPHKVVWAVRDDGVLLSLTYLKEQEIYAWARHDTQGIVEDVASVSENGRHAVYMIVKRYVDGAWHRYVERLAGRNFGSNPALGVSADAALAWCVDCGLSYDRTFPNATLTVEAIAGDGLGLATATTDVDTFVSGDVGKVVRGGGGVGVIIIYNNARSVRLSVSTRIAYTMPNDPDNTPLPMPPGSWSCTRPVTTVSGLDHLEGKTVSILADGVVQPTQVVTGGSITLSAAATAITVGLGYTWQLQTLPLGQPGTPTSKGRRKMINSMTVLMHESRGIEAGPTFSDLVPLRSEITGAIPTSGLQSGEVRVNVDSRWTMQGQMCLQGTDPIPATILAVVPEVVVGDT